VKWQAKNARARTGGWTSDDGEMEGSNTGGKELSNRNWRRRVETQSSHLSNHMSICPNRHAVTRRASRPVPTLSYGTVCCFVWPL
jgi:hypothetical protein